METATVSDADIYDQANADPQAFWAGWADQLEWMTPYQTVCEWNPPHAKWFTGGTLNASVNCLDRHIKTDKRNKAALIFEGEPGDTRVLTYYDLWREVNRFAGVLKNLNVGKGDRVTIYLPMICESVIAILACARIGAIHTVFLPGFPLTVARAYERFRVKSFNHCRRRMAQGQRRSAQIRRR